MFDLKTRVIVIDDMGTMRKIVTKACKDIGFTDIIDAADGALGWEVISTASPPIGLVISDWNMPNCTGLDLLKRLRNDKRFKDIPFVLVTAEAESHQILEAVKAGVSGYIVKPFPNGALAEKLEAVHKKMTS